MVLGSLHSKYLYRNYYLVNFKILMFESKEGTEKGLK